MFALPSIEQLDVFDNEHTERSLGGPSSGLSWCNMIGAYNMWSSQPSPGIVIKMRLLIIANIKNINYIKFVPILNVNKIIINKFYDTNLRKFLEPTDRKLENIFFENHAVVVKE